MTTVNQQLAQAGLELFAPDGASIAAPNVAALGYLPQSLIMFTDPRSPNFGRLRYKQAFTYSVEFTPIAAGATTTQTANVQADSDFVWISSNITITQTDNTTFVAVNAAAFLVSITDTASGAIIMDRAQHVNNFFGANGSPRVNLGVPFIFRRSGQIQVQLANQTAGTAFNVRIAFLGFKVFDIPVD